MGGHQRTEGEERIQTKGFDVATHDFCDEVLPATVPDRKQLEHGGQDKASLCAARGREGKTWSEDASEREGRERRGGHEGTYRLTRNRRPTSARSLMASLE